MPEPRPYGAWPSPISAAAVAAGPTPSEPCLRNGLHWLEERPLEGGRTTLVRGRPDGTRLELTEAPRDVRNRALEYGGGAYAVCGDAVVFAELTDGRVHRVGAGESYPLTPPGPRRYADLTPVPGARAVVAVRESRSGDRVVNELVWIDAERPGEPRVLVAGRDFYATPRPSLDGSRLAWVAWDRPAMPWDESELWEGELTADGALGSPRPVAGGRGESVVQPGWRGDGLFFLSDRSGWWNLHRRAGDRNECVAAHEADFAAPLWRHGLSTYGFLDDGRIAAVCTRGGIEQLVVVDVRRGGVSLAGLPFTAFPDGVLAVEGGRAAFVAGTPVEPPALHVVDLVRGGLTSVGDRDERFAAYFVEPETVELDSGARAFVFAPANPDARAPAGALPPLVVQVHGGPTSHSGLHADLEIAFWTSRGFAVALLDHRGSSGDGRASREALRGAWGVVDLEDAIAVTRALAGRVDAGALLVRGTSAGGYTTFHAVAAETPFAAGAARAGIADFELWRDDAHFFESRYLDSIVGPYPEEREAYAARSPARLVTAASRPLLAIHGLADAVVPPEHARRMAAAYAAAGRRCELLLLDGEEHKLRRADSVQTALEAELAFFRSVLRT